MKHSVQIGAVECEIGCAVACLGIGAERDLGEASPRKPVEDEDRRRPESHLLDCFQQAEPFEEAGRIRAKLDAGSALVAKVRALEHRDLKILPCECDRRGKAADAAAGNQVLAFRRSVSHELSG